MRRARGILHDMTSARTSLFGLGKTPALSNAGVLPLNVEHDDHGLKQGDSATFLA